MNDQKVHHFPPLQRYQMWRKVTHKRVTFLWLRCIAIASAPTPMSLQHFHWLQLLQQTNFEIPTVTERSSTDTLTNSTSPTTFVLLLMNNEQHVQCKLQSSLLIGPPRLSPWLALITANAKFVVDSNLGRHFFHSNQSSILPCAIFGNKIVAKKNSATNIPICNIAI